MLSKTVKAATTTTDQGEFTAIAAAYTVDRMNDQIMPGAFAATIGAWQDSGKMIPLHWDHGGDPSDIIGFVDPGQMREAAEGLYVKGKLDLKNSEMAREAWRVMKDNAVGLSFGYLVQDEAKNEDTGVVELKALDLFEITITPAPANPDTKLLSLKNAEDAEVESAVDDKIAAFVAVEAKKGDEDLAQGYEKIAYRLATSGISPPQDAAPATKNDAPVGILAEMISGAQDYIDSEPDPEDIAAMREVLKSLTALLSKDVAEGDKNVKDANKGATAQEPEGVTAQAPDSLSKDYEDIALRISTHGIVPEFKSPPVEEPPPEGPSLDELARYHDQLMYRLLTNH